MLIDNCLDWGHAMHSRRCMNFSSLEKDMMGAGEHDTFIRILNQVFTDELLHEKTIRKGLHKNIIGEVRPLLL